MHGPNELSLKTLLRDGHGTRAQAHEWMIAWRSATSTRRATVSRRRQPATARELLAGSGTEALCDTVALNAVHGVYVCVGRRTSSERGARLTNPVLVENLIMDHPG